MKKLFILLLIVGALATGCTTNEKMRNEESINFDGKSELLGEINSNKTTGDIVYIYKCEYLKKLDELEDSINTSGSLYEEESISKMIQIEEIKFETWNDELNNIYRVLKAQLSESEFEEFKNKEIKWLDNRVDTAENQAKEFEGMNFAEVEYNSYLAKLTKERCYKLVDIYLE